MVVAVALRIGSNILSQTIQRNLSRSSEALSTASTRLSSGQRINSASDDAAGLSIAMRLDTDRILTRTAQKNISDGISVISIIEAGLSSQKEILFRMAELAEQSANGTYSNQQRAVIQKEYSALMDEFDRIGESVEFNGIKLLRNRQSETVKLMAGITGADSSLLEVAALNSHRYSGRYDLQSDYNADNNFIDFDDLYILGGFAGSPLSYLESASDPSGLPRYASVTVPNTSGNQTTIRFSLSRTLSDFNDGRPNAELPVTPIGVEAIYFAEDDKGGRLAPQIITFDPSLQALRLSGILDNGASFTLDLDLSGIDYSSVDIPSGNLGAPSNIGLTNIETRFSAMYALDTIQTRVSDVSGVEGRIGAVGSRLRVAQAVLAASGENLAAASSRIKDADIAAESSSLVRTQILQQTSAALLGQANLSPLIALRLLQNA